MKHIEVAAAVLQHDGEYLSVQRGRAKSNYISHKWEFPGGKVEAGETPQQAIIRELKEELLLEVETTEHVITVEHEYPDFSITMHCFLCVVPSRNITLLEHVDYRWLDAASLMLVDWAAADIPVVKHLQGIKP